MSHLRFDPLTEEWVALATERALRPDEFRRHAGDEPVQARNACPFCPGREAEAGEETARLSLPDAPPDGWSVRVVRNRYPAFVRTAAVQPSENGLLREVPALGDHEVVVETPAHDDDLHALSPRHAALVMETYRQRFVSLHAQPGVQCVLPIRNHGARAGASLVHPHGQVLATQVEPPLVQRKRLAAERHHRTHGGCLHCALRETERRARQRVVFETAHFTVLHPYASRYPFETLLLPRRHAASFANADEAMVEDLAAALQRVLRQLERALGRHAYNCVLYSAPPAQAERPDACWHLLVVPRLIITGGFELGAGTIINQALPEQTASYLVALA